MSVSANGIHATPPTSTMLPFSNPSLRYPGNHFVSLIFPYAYLHVYIHYQAETCAYFCFLKLVLGFDDLGQEGH